MISRTRMIRSRLGSIEIIIRGCHQRQKWPQVLRLVVRIRGVPTVRLSVVRIWLYVVHLIAGISFAHNKAYLVHDYAHRPMVL